MSINKVILLGNLGKEPEIKNFDGGGKIASFTLATTKKGYTTKAGTTIPDKTEWHNVKCFNGLADVCEKYLHKGSKVYVEGEIIYREYEKDGVKKFVTEILVNELEMCDKATQTASNGVSQPQQTNTPTPMQQATQVVTDVFGVANDGLPF